jgi:hypothetical protein
LTFDFLPVQERPSVKKLLAVTADVVGALHAVGQFNVGAVVEI